MPFQTRSRLDHLHQPLGLLAGLLLKPGAPYFEPQLQRDGDAIAVQYANQKARFRVVWVASVGGTEYQAGIQAVEPLKELWRLDLPIAQDEFIQSAKAGQ